MKKLRINKAFSLILLVLFTFSLMTVPALAATKSELQEQKAEAEERLENAQYQVDLTQTTIDGILSELEKSQTAIDEINTKISTLDGMIASLESDLKKTKSDLAKTQKERDQLKKEMEERLRVMYMYGDEGYLEVFFSSTDFSDLITKIEVVASITKADRDAADKIAEKEAEIAAKEALIETEKEQQESAKQEQTELLVSQEEIKAQQDELLAQNKALLDDYKSEVAASEAEIQEANDGLAEIARQEQAAISSSSSSSSASSSASGSSSSSGFIWPTTSYVITSYFGYRESPGGIGSTNHMGLDIGASYGEPIYASASGTVTLAEWYGGYGNCVMVAHSSGWTTLYGHMSSICVSYGEYVNQGEVIGYVGSTGNSTGPHLHISFINAAGEFCDPLDYLPY